MVIFPLSRSRRSPGGHDASVTPWRRVAPDRNDRHDRAMQTRLDPRSDATSTKSSAASPTRRSRTRRSTADNQPAGATSNASRRSKIAFKPPSVLMSRRSMMVSASLKVLSARASEAALWTLCPTMMTESNTG